MYSTSYASWARAIGLDAALIGCLVAGIFFSVPHILQVSVFFLWWVAILNIFASFYTLVSTSVIASSISALKRKIALMVGEGADSHDIAEHALRIKNLQEAHLKRWPDSMVNSLAKSHTFLAYHWASDIAVWVLLLIAGHPVLATFTVISFLMNCILIGVARKKYRERNGLKD